MCSRAITTILRGLLLSGALLFSFFTDITATEIKVSITPPSPKEYLIEVTDSSGLSQKKITINHEASFDVKEGIIAINIEGKKKLKKQVYLPSIIQVLYND